MNEIYDLKLGEEFVPPMADPNTKILRVPGGWIYNIGHTALTDFTNQNNSHTAYTTLITSTFVPYVDDRLKSLLKGETDE